MAYGTVNRLEGFFENYLADVIPLLCRKAIHYILLATYSS
jgi:hypothetical protein